MDFVVFSEHRTADNAEFRHIQILIYQEKSVRIIASDLPGIEDYVVSVEFKPDA